MTRRNNPTPKPATPAPQDAAIPASDSSATTGPGSASGSMKLTSKTSKASGAPAATKRTPPPFSFEGAIQATPAPINTRERILHAAVTLLHEEGFAALTQQHVCERAGIRQSHLTYYFPTRNDLLRETAVFGCEALLHSMLEGARGGKLTLSKIRNEMFVADESDRRFGRLMIALIVASDEDTRIKPWLASFEVENRRKLGALLQAAGADATETDIETLHAAYVGAVMLDIGESSDASNARAQRIVHHAFDQLISKAGSSAPKPKSRK